ncbi:hypothetical protein [Achromobacter sp. E1]|uniref:hypothetical protein n=1 Tax=Achromobacter sp. E1 TaxID=3141581 RepID=UPI0030D0C524
MTPMESASDQKIRERRISSVSYTLEDYPASAKCSCCRSASRAAEPTSATTELRKPAGTDCHNASQSKVNAGGIFGFGSMLGSTYLGASIGKSKPNCDSVIEQSGLYAGSPVSNEIGEFVKGINLGVPIK